MKRKFWGILFTLIAALCLCFGLVACGESGTGNNGTQTEQGGNTQKPDEGEQGGSTQKPDEGGQGSTEPEKKEFTVTFNANGGEFEDGKSAFSVSVKENETLSLPEEPTRDKYEFVQWCTDSSLETAWDFSTPVTRAMTLYADWKALVTEFDVTFILNYEGAENVVRSTENGLVTFIPERADYVFNGWWLSDGLTESGDYILSQKWDTAEPVTEAGLRLVAEWVEKATASMQLPAPSVTINEAVFSWEAIAGAKEYDIRVYKAGSNTEETKDRTDGTTWTFPSGFDAGYYTVKIRALGDGMTTVNSAFVSKSYGHLILSKISEINFDISTSILTWTAVRKATSYVLYIDSVETKTLSYTSFDMSAYEAGSYSIKIIAKREGYLSSTVTTTIVKKRLKTPDVTVTKEDTGEFPYTIAWQPVAGADTYILTVNGVEHRFTDETSYTFDRIGDWGEERMIKISLSAFDSYADYAISNPFTAETERVNVVVKTMEGGTAKLEDGKRYGYIAADEQGTVVAKTNKGYTFVGWYKDEQEVSTELTFQFTMGKENVTYEARWEVSPEMRNFVFVSTEKTCTIIGVKDSEVLEIVIPEYITSIEDNAFCKCSGLKKITIPDSTISIGSGVFTNTFFYNEDGNWTGNVLYIGNHLIEARAALSGSYTIQEGTITIADGAFRNCSALTEIIIPDSVIVIGEEAFFGCSRLTGEIEIPQDVIRIGYGAFKDCKALNKIALPNGIISIDEYAFSGCAELKSITIPESVISIGKGAFSGCTGLEEIIIPDSAVSIGQDAFNSTAYYDLTSNWKNQVLYIGNHLIMAKSTLSGSYNIQAGTKTIAEYAFNNCNKLTRIIIPNSVTSIGEGAFPANSEELVVNISEDNEAYYVETNCFIEKATMELLLGNNYSIIPKGVTSIGANAFYGCSGLTSVTIGSGVTSIGANAFYGCSGLTEIIIPDSVTSIGANAFYGCSGLTSVSIGSGVISIGNDAFSGCSGLTSVTIGSGVTSIGSYAFCDCSKLTEIKIPDSVISIGRYAFKDCYRLTEITIPNGVTSIESGTFVGCTGLTKITIPNSVISIENFAFYFCVSLTEITIPGSVTSIGANAFWSCSGLEKVYFENPNGWKASGYGDMSPVSGLEDSATAAEYLRDTYYRYYWRRYD